MNKKISSQTGSAHVAIVVILVIALLGSLGFIFWQNFYTANDKKVVEQSSSQKETKPDATTHQDKINTAKTEITASMNNNYDGLSAHMISSLDGAIANSDGIFSDKTNEELASLISDYFGTSNPSLSISGEWFFSDYKELSNDKLTAQLQASSFTDYASSYVGIAKAKSGDDVFVAYSLNDDGLITYAFWGVVL